ncbi:MAG TPA: GNAT family N-acetyltransferase [Egibacteraceae bacterium]|nr:GNAT family N-acetyltransferase [Egibacteraceae bacterium]
MSDPTDGQIRVDRARLEEVQPLAAEYRRDASRQGSTVEPPLPTGAVFWVARDAAREILGYAAGQLRPEGLVLGPFYVRERARRLGVGLKLLRAIEEWATGARIPVVEVSVAADNPGGVRFLEAAGYRTRRLLMAREDAGTGLPEDDEAAADAATGDGVTRTTP